MEIECSGISNVQPITIQWSSKEGMPVTQQGSSIIFPAIYRNQSGTYTCVMTVGAVSKTHSIKMDVNCKYISDSRRYLSSYCASFILT